MMMTDPNDDMLDDIFAEARAVAPTPSDDLMARVLPDATSPQPVSAPPRRMRLWEMIGGWPALGALVTATVAGVWVGIAPPATVETYAAQLFGEEISVSLLSDGAFFDTGDLTDG